MCHTAVANIAVHNWKRTPSVTNRSPRPMEDGMRFHDVCLSFIHIRLGDGILGVLTQPIRQIHEQRNYGVKDFRH